MKDVNLIVFVSYKDDYKNVEDDYEYYYAFTKEEVKEETYKVLYDKLSGYFHDQGKYKMIKVMKQRKDDDKLEKLRAIASSLKSNFR
jgi:hypothetical protein